VAKTQLPFMATRRKMRTGMIGMMMAAKGFMVA
jgi:hypothetical protein